MKTMYEENGPAETFNVKCGFDEVEDAIFGRTFKRSAKRSFLNSGPPDFYQ